MGLLDKVRGKAPKEVPELLNRTDRSNISARAIRVEIPEGDEGANFEGARLEKADGKLRALCGDTLLFEVTSRSKAYNELDEFVGKELRYITIRKRRSDYGVFYMVSVGTKMSASEFYK